MPGSDDRFAHQNRCGPPPEFPLASACPGIVHHLSGPDGHALARPRRRHNRDRPALHLLAKDHALFSQEGSFAFTAPSGFTWPRDLLVVRVSRMVGKVAEEATDFSFRGGSMHRQAARPHEVWSVLGGSRNRAVLRESQLLPPLSTHHLISSL